MSDELDKLEEKRKELERIIQELKKRLKRVRSG
jgi:phage shock protein A